MVLLAIDLIFQKIMVNEAIGIKIIGGPPPIVNQIRLGDARDAWTGCVLTVRAAESGSCVVLQAQQPDLFCIC